MIIAYCIYSTNVADDLVKARLIAEAGDVMDALSLQI